MVTERLIYRVMKTNTNPMMSQTDWFPNQYLDRNPTPKNPA